MRGCAHAQQAFETLEAGPHLARDSLEAVRFCEIGQLSGCLSACLQMFVSVVTAAQHGGTPHDMSQ